MNYKKSYYHLGKKAVKDIKQQINKLIKSKILYKKIKLNINKSFDNKGSNRIVNKIEQFVISRHKL